MRDVLIEIWESVRRNKLRTALTGFAVSWGIFMLIVLLGAGNGLMNAFTMGGEGLSTNTMMVYGGRTSKPYDGLQSGRSILLEETDLDLTAGSLFEDHVDEVIASVSTSSTAVYGKKSVSGNLEGSYPIRQKIEKIELRHGRFINEKDIRDRRKVVVLPEGTAENLLGTGRQDSGASFGRRGFSLAGESGIDVSVLIGKYVRFNGLSFRVVGITKSNSMSSDNSFFAPFSTVRSIYAKGQTIDDLSFTFHGLDTEEDNEAFEAQYRSVINRQHRAAPDDERAIYIHNQLTQNMQINKVHRVISTSLWILGIFTLLGGIVGVGNIMLITVKERTHEFGIRKAIGAGPWSIMKLILAESVSITAFFGYIGMLLGMICCQILDKTLGQSTVSIMDEEIAMLVNPTVGLDTAVGATLLLIIAGTLAGLFPAYRASRVRPIEALRAE